MTARTMTEEKARLLILERIADDLRDALEANVLQGLLWEREDLRAFLEALPDVEGWLDDLADRLTLYPPATAGVGDHGQEQEGPEEQEGPPTSPKASGAGSRGGPEDTLRGPDGGRQP